MIILDSSFLIAFHNTRDAHHPQATEIMSRFLEGEWGHGLLLEHIFLEVVTVLAARVDLAAAIDVGDTLLRASELEFVACSDVFPGAYATFRSQGGSGLSLADAAIVAVARERGVPCVATYDDDFRKIREIAVVS